MRVLVTEICIKSLTPHMTGYTLETSVKFASDFKMPVLILCTIILA